MALATIIEKYNDTPFVNKHIYHSWWFIAMWGAIIAISAYQIIKLRVKNFVFIALHCSFVIILLGAFITHIFGEKGIIYLEKGKPTNTFEYSENENTEKQGTLPFYITLNKFDVKYYNGTEAASDYASHITINDNNKTTRKVVSINNIATYNGVRLYQTGYNESNKTSALSINKDPWGIAITYIGYCFLFISLISMLISKKGAFRQTLKNPLLKKGLFVLFVLFSCASTQSTFAQKVLPQNTANEFGYLKMLYNDRICLVETFALDFTKKIYGSRKYKNLTPQQVLCGWIFWGEEWSNEPFIEIKKADVRNKLFLPKYASLNDFFDAGMQGYLLGPYLQEFNNGKKDAFHQQIADIDEKIMLIMEVRRGIPLKLFPVKTNNNVKWFSPTDKLPKTISQNEKLYISQIFNVLYQDALTNNWNSIDQIVHKMQQYQLKNAGNSMPSNTAIKAEHLYNSTPFATILFMFNLALGLVALVVLITNLTSNASSSKSKINQYINVCLSVALYISFIALTICEVLRWIISGTIPMSNGYETMLIIAWFILLFAIIAHRKFPILKMFAFILSGFFLLVSHLSQMNPQITNVMPVLNSPLLSIHVSVIMMGYALLSFTFICSLTALIAQLVPQKKHSLKPNNNGQKLQLLSMLFLYPALVALGIGIFIGAIWANISWGQYWTWDPKETWALITFMTYATPAHFAMLPSLKKPMMYHIYMFFAFATVIITYFGVNYFLGGMHSYA